MKKLCTKTILLLLCLLLALPQAVAEETAQHDELQSQVDAICKKWHAVGVSAAYVKEGRVVDTFAYGYAVKNKEKMTADTKVRAASISKVLVGLATHISAENGVLTIEDSVDDYLGFRIRLRHSEDRITIRSILTHTSSISIPPSTVTGEYNVVKTQMTSAGAVLNVQSGKAENWLYNNYAFCVLGIAVERANQKTMDQILDEAFEDALEIDASFWVGDLKDTQNVASIYNVDHEVARSKESQITLHSSGVGKHGGVFAGGYCTSAYDMGKIVAMLAADGCYEGEQVISTQIVSAMEECLPEKIANNPFYQAQPLRYQEDIYGRSGLYYHTGSTYGELNLIIYDPVAQDGVVVFSTGSYGRDQYGIYSVCGAIAELLLNTEWQE